MNNKEKLSSNTILIILYELAIVFSTFFNGVDLSSAITNAIKIVSFALFIEYYFKKCPKMLLDEMHFIIGLYLIINALSLVFSHNFAIGENNTKVYFLGIRTRFTDCIFPFLLISLIKYRDLSKKRIKLLISIFLCIFNIIYVHIGTALGGIIILVCLIFLDEKYNLLKNITAKLSTLISLLLNISICFFRIQNIFSYFIVNVLHKNVTLTNRTIIWDDALLKLKNHFILGCGVKDSQGRFAFYRGRYIQCHNQILQIISEGGLIALLFYIVMILKCVTKIDKNSKIYSSSVAMIVTVIIMMTTERYGRYVYFYIILYIIYFSKNIIISFNKGDKKNEI